MHHQTVAVVVMACASGAAGTALGDDLAPPPGAAERQGVLIGGDVALGFSAKALLTQLDGRLGWMVSPRLGVFGAVLIGRGVGPWDIEDYHLEAVGLRAWVSGAWFLEGRVGWAHTAIKDEVLDDVPNRASGPGYLVGLGVEGVWSRVGLDAHLAAFRTEAITGILLGVGVSYY